MQFQWKNQKRPLGRCSCRWEDAIVVDHREIGLGGDFDWIFGVSGSGQRPVAGSCEHGNKPLGSIKCWKFMNG
jgi:hypothetical protein